MSRPLRLGDHVKRGYRWAWSEQDAPNGIRPMIGVVISCTEIADDPWFLVQWPNGTSYNYPQSRLTLIRIAQESLP